MKKNTLLIALVIMSVLVALLLLKPTKTSKDSEVTETTTSMATSSMEVFTVKVMVTDNMNTPKEYEVSVSNKDETAFELLEGLKQETADFTYEYEEYDFGNAITSINGQTADSSKEFWAFLVNNEASMVGVSDYVVQEGDKLSFQLEPFN